MALETATYITDLVDTNPVHTDGLNQMDSHLRLIKTVLKNQFPNLGDAAITATAAALNAAVALQASGPGPLTVPYVSANTNSEIVLLSDGTAGHDIKLVNTGAVLQVYFGTNATNTWNSAASFIINGDNTTVKAVMTAGSVNSYGSISAQGGSGSISEGVTPLSFVGEIRILASGHTVPTGWSNIGTGPISGSSYIQRMS